MGREWNGHCGFTYPGRVGEVLGFQAETISIVLMEMNGHIVDSSADPQFMKSFHKVVSVSATSLLIHRQSVEVAGVARTRSSSMAQFSPLTELTETKKWALTIAAGEEITGSRTPGLLMPWLR